MPARNSIELDHLGFSQRRVERWLWILAALGVSLRLLAYLLRQPLFTDEAKLATSLLDRDYAGMLEPLVYHQIAPVLFMWIQETSTRVFGFSEYSLRLVPVTAACVSVLLMRHLSRRLLAGAPAVFAMALFAVSYYPIRHGAELKPYATDLLASLALTALAAEWLRRPGQRWLWLLAASGPLAIMLSYTASFVVVGVLAALLIPVFRRRDRPSALAWTIATLLSGASFALNVLLVAGSQYELRAAANFPMKGGFPPPGDLLGTFGWLVGAHTGRTFGYPLGGENGGSLLTFAAFLTGAVVLWRAGRRRLLPVLLAPFAAGLVAALLQKYPYGGSGRVSQYLVPAICLLAGVGAARLSSLARRPATWRQAQRGVLGFFVVFGVLFAVSTLVRPYRDRPDMVGRDFARWLWDVKSRDAVLVSAWDDLRLDFARPPDGWAPGGAAFRLYQRIYGPRSGGAAPDLTSVSHQRPLRVVFLASALKGRRPALEAWLTDMRTRYELLDRERHRLGPYKEQHHGLEDSVELYTFVPRETP